MERPVADLGHANATNDYFNGFHDGFIKSLTIRSHDRFPEWGQQQASQRLHIDIVFAHYNYQGNQRPADQLIAGRFEEVMGVAIDFGGKLYEWSINNVSFAESTRTVEDDSTEPCLVATIAQQRLVDGAWHVHNDVTFSFLRATFEEL